MASSTATSGPTMNHLQKYTNYNTYSFYFKFPNVLLFDYSDYGYDANDYPNTEIAKYTFEDKFNEHFETIFNSGKNQRERWLIDTFEQEEDAEYDEEEGGSMSLSYVIDIVSPRGDIFQFVLADYGDTIGIRVKSIEYTNEDDQDTKEYEKDVIRKMERVILNAAYDIHPTIFRKENPTLMISQKGVFRKLAAYEPGYETKEAGQLRNLPVNVARIVESYLKGGRRKRSHTRKRKRSRIHRKNTRKHAKNTRTRR